MLENKKVTIVGLGISGFSAAIFLRQKNIAVKVTDNTDNPQIRQKAEELEKSQIEYELGGHTQKFLDGTELLIVSPGVANDALPIKWAEERRIPIISEIELGYKFCQGSIIAVSGTNGKSTVTSMIGEVFKKAGRNVFVCGNIGTPFTSLVSSIAKDDTVVLEVSSFQLERIEAFRPHIAIMLNITQDHLDRYQSFDAYVDAKIRLFMNQKSEDYSILNYEQTRLKNLKDSIDSKVLYFSKHTLPKECNGAYVENNELVVRMDGRYVWMASKDSLSLNGEHNLENALASALASFILGVGPDIIKDVLYSFKSLNHRFESVGIIDGVKFVDDSKATNIDSTRRAIQASPKGIILIAGGRDKGGDYRVLAKILKEKVKLMVLIGEAKEKIAQAFSGAVPISFSLTLSEAVRIAFQNAKRGDMVLLSPMCSSFDMFKDYKERGEVFRQAVAELEKQNA